jgi:hypothetical protein
LRFPKIRWDEGIFLDTILYMNTLAQLVDRRMLSYRTSLEALGFDYPNELKNMEEEMPLVEDGTFGILGSPWQQAKQAVLQILVGPPLRAHRLQAHLKVHKRRLILLLKLNQRNLTHLQTNKRKISR